MKYNFFLLKGEFILSNAHAHTHTYTHTHTHTRVGTETGGIRKLRQLASSGRDGPKGQERRRENRETSYCC